MSKIVVPQIGCRGVLRCGSELTHVEGPTPWRDDRKSLLHKITDVGGKVKDLPDEAGVSAVLTTLGSDADMPEALRW